MNFKKVSSVYKKEIKETLRDKRTIIFAILVPLFLYPLLSLAGAKLISVGMENMEEEISHIAIKGKISSTLQKLLEDDKKLEIVESKEASEDIKERIIHAYLELKEKDGQEEVIIYYDNAESESRQAEDRLWNIVKKYKRVRQEEGLTSRGVEIKLLDIVEVRTANVAPPEKVGGSIIGTVIPLMLIITLLMGAMYPAIDLTAGEKERGTLETVLSLPVTRMELIFGKYLTVVTISIITGVLNLVSMMLVYSFLLSQADFIEISLSLGTILLLFVLIIPLVLFISAITLSTCIFAKSFKEAQNYMSPLMLVLMLPAYIPMMPGVELNEILAIVPIINISLLFKEILLQNINIDQIFIVFLSNSIYAFVTIFLFAKLFNSEKVLFAEDKGIDFSFNRKDIREKKVLDISSTLFILAISLLLLLYAGTYLQVSYGILGVGLTQLLAVLAPTLIGVWYWKGNFKSVFSLRRVDFKALVLSILMWVGAYIFILFLSSIINQFLPNSELFEEAIRKLFSESSLGGAILIVAVAPAICEELLFRGLLLSSLRIKLSKRSSIVIVSLLFSLYHMNLYQLVPTFILGMVLTYVVYKTGSIYPAIIIHFINNLLAVLAVFHSQSLVGISLSNNSIVFSLLMAVVMIFGGKMFEKKIKNRE